MNFFKISTLIAIASGCALYSGCEKIVEWIEAPSEEEKQGSIAVDEFSQKWMENLFALYKEIQLEKSERAQKLKNLKNAGFSNTPSYKQAESLLGLYDALEKETREHLNDYYVAYSTEQESIKRITHKADSILPLLKRKFENLKGEVMENNTPSLSNPEEELPNFTDTVEELYYKQNIEAPSNPLIVEQ